MAFELKKDWPVVAAAGAAVVGAVLLTKQTSGQQPIVYGGGGDGEGYAAALQAQTQITTAELGVKRDLFSILIGEYGATEREKIQAGVAMEALDVKRAEISGQLESSRAASAAERQKAEYGFLGNIIAGIFGLFSWETTKQAISNRGWPREPYQPFVWGKFEGVRA